MAKYVVKRIAYMLVVLLILSFIMFMIYNMVPSNRAYTDAFNEVKGLSKVLSPDEVDAKFEELYLQYQRKYGTDTDSKILQYARWMGFAPLYDGSFNGLLQGNFGYSNFFKQDVIKVIEAPMSNTIFINIFSTIAALSITIPLGIYCAVHKGKKIDSGVQVVTMVGYSMPIYIIALIFMFFFCVFWRIFPISGTKTAGAIYTSGWEEFVDMFKHICLPVIVMTFASLGGMTRYVRSSMIDALSMDYIRTARAKGLKEKVVIYSHAWRNALLPVITSIIGWFLSIFSGSVIIENTFSLNGMGKLYWTGLNNLDYELVLAIQMFYTVISLMGSLLMDISYGLVDPRVRVDK